MYQQSWPRCPRALSDSSVKGGLLAAAAFQMDKHMGEGLLQAHTIAQWQRVNFGSPISRLYPV